MGDTNGDNEVSVRYAVVEGKYNLPQSELYSADYAAARDAFDQTASWDEAHFYRECSNKGVCDSTTGACACFPGYEGTACARTSCPKGCSGHGQCKNYEGTQYQGWDKESSTYCHCDAGYSGPGCENRLCPSGIDPVQAANLDTSRFQRIAFRGVEQPDNNDVPFADLPYGDVYFTITLVDEFGDSWTTELLTVKYDIMSPQGKSAGKAGAGQTPANSGYAVYPRLLSSTETVGEYSRKHVAQTVEDALHQLPHNVAGKVKVHEIYSMSGSYQHDIADDNSQKEFAAVGAKTQIGTDWAGLFCGTDDIYHSAMPDLSDVNSAAVPPVVGCGLAIPTMGGDTALMDKGRVAVTANDRDGNWDIYDQSSCIVNAQGKLVQNDDVRTGRLASPLVDTRRCGADDAPVIVQAVCATGEWNQPVVAYEPDIANSWSVTDENAISAKAAMLPGDKSTNAGAALGAANACEALQMFWALHTTNTPTITMPMMPPIVSPCLLTLRTWVHTLFSQDLQQLMWMVPIHGQHSGMSNDTTKFSNLILHRTYPTTEVTPKLPGLVYLSISRRAHHFTLPVIMKNTHFVSTTTTITSTRTCLITMLTMMSNQLLVQLLKDTLPMVQLQLIPLALITVGSAPLLPIIL
jgi:hypothetical protein